MKTGFRICALMLLFFSNTASADRLIINTINCKVSEKERIKIEKLLDYERNLYNQIFNTDTNDTITIKINLYGKFKEFNEARGTVNKSMKESEGYYSAQTRQSNVYKGSNFISVIIHETSHNLLHANLKKVPNWLHEGMAEFFERFDLDEKGKLFFTPQGGVLRIFKNLFTVKIHTGLYGFLQKMTGNGIRMSLMSYIHRHTALFIFSSRKMVIVKRIIQQIKNKKTSVEAINNAYRGGFSKFEADYKYFYKSYGASQN